MSPNHFDPDLVNPDPLSVMLLPPAVGGYGNASIRRSSREADTNSQAYALLSGLRHWLSAQCGLMHRQFLVGVEVEFLDCLLGHGARHAFSHQLSDDLRYIDGMDAGTVE